MPIIIEKKKTDVGETGMDDGRIGGSLKKLTHEIIHVARVTCRVMRVAPLLPLTHSFSFQRMMDFVMKEGYPTGTICGIPKKCSETQDHILLDNIII
jgi:hypothetical protein